MFEFVSHSPLCWLLSYYRSMCIFGSSRFNHVGVCIINTAKLKKPKMFLSWPACQLVVFAQAESRERTAQDMELSDGLLLQVNNGDQWCNRWKNPNEDSVSYRPGSEPFIFAMGYLFRYNQPRTSFHLMGVQCLCYHGVTLLCVPYYSLILQSFCVLLFFLGPQH